METTRGRVAANGIEIAYQSFGPASRETVLLIPGVGGQMDDGPSALAQALVARGYRVIAYDSRDAGSSTHMTAAGMPNWEAIQAALVAGNPPPVAYSLRDLSNDAIGLLDALGIKRAHIVGGSLGGMVAQTIAADHPDRTLSLTSISSSTGNPNLPPGPAAALAASAPSDQNADAALAHAIGVARALESPAYRADDATLRARITAALRRPQDPAGVARQGAAAAVAGDRRTRLKTITAPTAVIHGDADAMFPVEHGRDTAANIPGAALHVIHGIGHNLPDALVPIVVDDIVAVAMRSSQK